MRYIFRGIESLLSLFLKDVELPSVIICFTVFYCVLIAAQMLLKRNITIRFALTCFILSVYYTFIISLTILGRKAGVITNRPDNAFSISTLITDNPEHYYDLAYNMLLFVPLGILISAAGYKCITSSVVVALTTIIIEAVQMLTGRGLFELSDIIGNFAGGIIGVGLFCMIKHLFGIFFANDA